MTSYPELIHILKTGFDLEHDSSVFEADIQSLFDVTQILLKSTHDWDNAVDIYSKLLKHCFFLI